MGIFYLTVLKVSSLRSRCHQGLFLLRAMRKNLFHASSLLPSGLLAICGASWLVDTSPQSLISCSHDILPVRLSVSTLPLFTRTPVILDLGLL